MNHNFNRSPDLLLDIQTLDMSEVEAGPQEWPRTGLERTVGFGCK